MVSQLISDQSLDHTWFSRIQSPYSFLVYFSVFPQAICFERQIACVYCPLRAANCIIETFFNPIQSSGCPNQSKVVSPQKNGKKVTTAPGNKVGETKSLAPMFAEKLISPHRKGATRAKLPKDRSAKLGDHEKRNENCEEDEDQNAKTLLIKNLPDKVIQHELKEVFEDGFQIRLVSKDGMSKRADSSKITHLVTCLDTYQNSTLK
ncbi:uncharacterized protein LOC107504983 [Rousettus aegyptiacus]|uniref:uncharacterized protein LOC107504983 n=1 Tax=Rousettus aegyptiacus TaxID=9407 RepID=UPI000786AB39|nr:uncharacterized protein LOC107504983 [Rousettus aegyptiacus]